MRQALSVSLYLLRNNLNAVFKPLLRSRAGKLALAAILAVLATPPLYANTAVVLHGAPPAQLARAWLPAGLDKGLVLSSTSVFLTFMVLLAAIRGPHEITASEEAEYEVLLSLPLTMPEYVLGKLGYFVAQSLLASVAILVAGVSLAPLVNGGSVAKSLLLPLAYLFFLMYSEALIQLVIVARAAAGSRVWAVSLAALAYLGAALAHSAAEGAVSPMLTAPTVLAVAPLLHCFTISEPPVLVLSELAALIAANAALLAVLFTASSRLKPEHVKPLSEVARGLLLRGSPRRSRLAARSFSAAVRRVVLELSLLSPRHLALVAGAMTSAALAGYAARVVLPRLDASLISSFAISVLVLEMTISTGNIALRDLSPLWLYRVASPDLKPLATSLLLKCILYYTESFAVVAVLLTAITGNPAHLLLPLAAAPASAASAVLAIWFLAHVAARRRLVRYSSRGFYLLEDLVATIVMGFSLVAAVFSITAFDLLLRYAGGTALFNAFPAASAAVGAVIALIGRDLISDVLSTADVAG